MGSLDNLHSGQRSIKFNEWVNPPKRKILRYASKLKLVDQWLAVIKDYIPKGTTYGHHIPGCYCAYRSNL